MINQDENPQQWFSLLYELEDCAEHLSELIAQMSKDKNIDKIDFKIQMAHVYAHLNRGWNSRNQTHDYTDKERCKLTSMPDDLEPVG